MQGWSYGPGATCLVTVSCASWAGSGKASEINLWHTHHLHQLSLSPSFTLSPLLRAFVLLLSLPEVPDLELSPKLPFLRQALTLQRKDSFAERVWGWSLGRRGAMLTCYLSDHHLNRPLWVLHPNSFLCFLIRVLAIVVTNYLHICKKSVTFLKICLAGITIIIMLLLRIWNFSSSLSLKPAYPGFCSLVPIPLVHNQLIPIKRLTNGKHSFSCLPASRYFLNLPDRKKTHQWCLLNIHYLTPHPRRASFKGFWVQLRNFFDIDEIPMWSFWLRKLGNTALIYYYLQCYFRHLLTGNGDYSSYTTKRQHVNH